MIRVLFLLLSLSGLPLTIGQPLDQGIVPKRLITGLGLLSKFCFRLSLSDIRLIEGEARQPAECCETFKKVRSNAIDASVTANNMPGADDDVCISFSDFDTCYSNDSIARDYAEDDTNHTYFLYDIDSFNKSSIQDNCVVDTMIEMKEYMRAASQAMKRHSGGGPVKRTDANYSGVYSVYGDDCKKSIEIFVDYNESNEYQGYRVCCVKEDDQTLMGEIDLMAYEIQHPVKKNSIVASTGNYSLFND